MGNLFSTRPSEDVMVQCWREIDWSQRDQLKADISGNRPRNPGVPYISIALFGPPGFGKSSYFNTIDSIFKGSISARAEALRAEESVTKRFRIYVLGEGQGMHFRLCDTRGLEIDQGLDMTDIPYILDGHIPDGFELRTGVRITRQSPGFIETPTLAQRIHCICYVVDSTADMDTNREVIRKFQTLRQMASARDIRIAILLTKVDTLSPLVSGDLQKVHKSKAVQDVVNKVSELSGLPKSLIFPVKNYESEVELNPTVDVLALIALRQMIQYANDVLPRN